MSIYYSPLLILRSIIYLRLWILLMRCWRLMGSINKLIVLGLSCMLRWGNFRKRVLIIGRSWGGIRICGGLGVDLAIITRKLIIIIKPISVISEHNNAYNPRKAINKPWSTPNKKCRPTKTNKDIYKRNHKKYNNDVVIDYMKN